MRIKSSRLMLILMLMMLFPTLAWANDLNVEYVEVPQAGTPAKKADVAVYFNIQNSDNIPIAGITKDNCSITINGKKPKVLGADIIPFTAGNRGVGVLFIFPVAKIYQEGTFAIRASLSFLLEKFKRDLDWINFVPYDITASPSGWKRASDSGVSQDLKMIKTSDVLEPNLFTAFQPAVSLLKNLEGVDQKYVVIISDAEGAIVGQQERAIQLIGSFTDQLKKEHITPIVIGYSPDGLAAMPNASLLKRIATNTNGAYFQAENPDQFLNVLTENVYNYIFGRYIYRAMLDMSKHYLEQKEYNLKFTVKTGASKDTANYQVNWPALEK